MLESWVVKGVGILAVLAVLFASAVMLALGVVREVAPLSEETAIGLLAQGRPPQRPLPASSLVPGSLTIHRRPQPHSAEIEATFQVGRVKVKRRMILSYRPHIVSASEDR